MAGAAHAGYLGLAVESYVGDGWVENGFAGLTAWRIYAEFSDPNDALVSVFGSPLNTLSLVSGDGSFYNDLVFDSTGPPENVTGPPHFHWANQWDTYVTIGVDDAAAGEVFVDPEFCGRLRFSCMGNNASAYYVLPGAPHSHPVNGRVLLAQLTVAEGESVSGVLNLQFDGGAQALDQPFLSPDPCPEDLNHDGVVNVLDLLQLLAAWGPCPACPEDLNGDGVVNVLDLLIVLAAWGPCS